MHSLLGAKNGIDAMFGGLGFIEGWSNAGGSGEKGVYSQYDYG